MTKPAAAHDHPDGTRTYPIPHPDTGEILELPSITNIISVTDPKHLCDWNLKMVTLGAAMREDLAVKIAAANLLPSGPARNSELRRLTIEAHEAGQLIEKGHIPADRGTGYHTLTERLDELVPPGEVAKVDELGLPRPVAEIACAYVDAMRGVRVLHSEATVVSFKHGYAGTGDRIIAFEPLDAWTAVFDQYDLGRGCFAFDNKFGTQMHPTFAMQLAAIVNAEYVFDADTQELTPLRLDIRRDVGFVFAPDKGLVPVDLTDAYAAFLGALAIRRFNDLDPLQPPLRPRREPVHVSAPLTQVVTQTATQVVTQTANGPVIDVFAGLPDDNGAPQVDRAAKRAWLLERVEGLAAKEGGLEALAARWPADVATFKHAPEHTVEELAAIERAIIDAEAAVTAPFCTRPDPTDPRTQYVAADDLRLTALVDQRAMLPPDLARRVAQELADAKVPTTVSKLTEAHLPAMFRIVIAAVAEARERAQRVTDALAVAAEHGVDEGVLLDAAGGLHAELLTADQAATVDELADAIHAGVIVQRQGALVVDQPALLLAAFGRDRRRVLAAGQRAARARNLPVPERSDDVLSNPLLAAAIHAF